MKSFHEFVAEIEVDFFEKAKEVEDKDEKDDAEGDDMPKGKKKFPFFMKKKEKDECSDKKKK